MTAVRVTPGEARRMGVPVPSGRSRRTARAPYHTRCMKCGAVFVTQASEDRHVDSIGGHNRFELVLEYPAPPDEAARRPRHGWGRP